MVEFTKVKHSTILKVKIAGYTKLEEIAHKNNAITYGGYVRDTLISQEFSERFRRKYPCNEDFANSAKFWDKTFDPETRKRLLIPSDMDLGFRSSDDVDNFISEIQRVEEFDKVVVTDVSNHKYYSPKIHSVKHVLIYMVIGRIPFLTSGSTVLIHADLVVPKANIMLEPPFNNLDFLCNGFIKTKEGIRFSRNTGTVIDFYTDFQRMQVSCGILSDMLQLKTYMCFSKSMAVETTSYKFNLVAMRRIMNMHNKGWTFNNMPFKTEVLDISTDQKECTICFSDFEKGEKLAYTVLSNTSSDGTTTEVCSCKMHYNCFMKYLASQRIAAAGSEPEYYGDVYVFRCPHRNPVDFRQCIFDIRGVYLS